MTVLECTYFEPHTHEYPEGWEFGGATGADPRADPRYEATTYTYFDADVTVLWVTQAPLCDEQAIEEFTKIANMSRRHNPRWLSAKRPDGSDVLLPWVYDKSEDVVDPVEASNGG